MHVSLIIIVEMRADSLIGNRLEIRITYSNVEFLSERIQIYGLCN
jgi:hypothetical protein